MQPVRCFLLLCCAVLGVLLGACASGVVPTPAADARLFHDDGFAAPAERIDAGQVFALSAPMRQLLETPPANSAEASDPRRHLIDLLYGRRRLALEYDSTLTRNASETFAARSGNCLSLVIMTAAFAKAAGLPLEYHQVLIDDAWTRSGDLFFASGHVNMLIGWSVAHSRYGPERNDEMVIDFLPADEVRGMRWRSVGERTIVAMYMNNRAAESLARGAVDDAYWWAREAVLQDPGFLVAYNTLGVIYNKRGQPRWAQAVFQVVLAREPDNTKVLGNLVNAMQADGRAAEARPWSDRLARLEPVPPFQFLRAGQAAAQRQDWSGAREMFRKEAERQPYNAEVHFWLAQANYQLGATREADRHLELARQNSTTPQDHALYAAKLGWLRAHDTDAMRAQPAQQ